MRSITGTATLKGTARPQAYTFQQGIDFLFSEGDNAIVWQQKDSTLPDDIE